MGRITVESSRRGYLSSGMWSMIWIAILFMPLGWILQWMTNYYATDDPLRRFSDSEGVSFSWIGVAIIGVIILIILLNFIKSMVASYRDNMTFQLDSTGFVTSVTTEIHRLFGGKVVTHEVVNRILKITVVQNRMEKSLNVGDLSLTVVRMVNAKAHEEEISITGVNNPHASMRQLLAVMRPHEGLMVDLKK